MKKEINVFDYAADITKALPKGVLLTTKAGGKVNTMTIGWGFLGIEWGKPMFIAMIRTGRFTKKLLDANPAFTVNIPYGPVDRKDIAFCGTTTGRQTDKIKEAGLTLVEPSVINVPAIQEYPLTLECNVLYQQLQDAEAIPAAVRQAFYPPDVASTNTGANHDFHMVYHAEIVKSYIIEP